MGHEKDGAACDADLKRTTDQRNERLETVWGWKRNGIFDLATKGEIERLIAASEEAERAVHQREIVERAYYEHKRTSDQTADDWREIVGAITYAGYDAAGKEATPDWAWFANAVLPLAQCQCDESIAAALNIRNAIMKRIRESEINEAVVRKLSGVDVRPEIKALRTDIGETKSAATRAATEAKAAHEETKDARKDFADLGDTMCEIVGEERIPPEWKEIDERSRRELYELVKKIKAKRTGKHGALDRFMDAATWRFRGFTVREIFKDTFTLDQFYNAERMKKDREQKSGNA